MVINGKRLAASFYPASTLLKNRFKQLDPGLVQLIWFQGCQGQQSPQQKLNSNYY